jgi:hypothetical protein
MKQQFDRKLRLSTDNKARLTQINEILEEYVEDGYRLTLRQLYYQLVSRDFIPNKQDEYKKLMNILKKGRMAGIVDWDAIEDRVRKPILPYWVTGIQDAINDTIRQYRLNRMEGQEQNIEVWVEKDALSGVLSRVTNKYHIRLMVNRGYTSISALYDAQKRLNNGDVILYFGDHDPSGLDMLRDIKDRMLEFHLDVEVVPIALTMQQVRAFNPPPNPAKFEDPRAEWYIREYGKTSWELDALPPKELIRLCEESILQRIDLDLYHDVIKQEQKDIITMKSKFNLNNEDDE